MPSMMLKSSWFTTSSDGGRWRRLILVSPSLAESLNRNRIQARRAWVIANTTQGEETYRSGIDHSILVNEVPGSAGRAVITPVTAPQSPFEIVSSYSAISGSRSGYLSSLVLSWMRLPFCKMDKKAFSPGIPDLLDTIIHMYICIYIKLY